ncbi:MAG: Nif3-like dinuclear metal center hexameric protein [Defluviitaleaceae bacterium]|nr:Nif3-like dinuclear metal center hexameric protein [Defluviitaleaceae bacterium]
MNAKILYNQLGKDFVTPQMTDYNWSGIMGDMADFVCDEYKTRNMGLMCDFADEINKVFTAVFPSDAVLKAVLNDGVQDAIIFVHHPIVWDLSKDDTKAWYDVNAELLQEMKRRKISLFNYHVPLDSFGEYSTSKTLAETVGVIVKTPFIPYHGGLCGVWGYANLKNATDLNAVYSQAVGHKTKIYQYGNDEIADGKIAVVAGGGNDVDVLTELVTNGINTLVTGVTRASDYTKAAHDFAKANKINLLGGTHYSSEKYACIAMVDYFKNLGIDAEFVADEPCFEDM